MNAIEQFNVAYDNYIDAAHMVHELSTRARLEHEPSVDIWFTDGLDAGSKGPSFDPVIAVSLGMLARLTKRQLFAILAHEIGHIKLGHISMPMVLGQDSWDREFAADMMSAELTNDPEGLVEALQLTMKQTHGSIGSVTHPPDAERIARLRAWRP